ncbi:carboxy-terminal domain RNA polymerase II polypeptide A small phosphatase 1-like [Populus alba x Populus x berolinensis]|uniref:Carboxy-terminal domain RNA polymerase II polypeptide A small phosphatase 1-like n=1 Tax=Populus alba x Populus x berolinensis TaxID=444605 RepID=A0AAD6R0W3_9ROSI|nr:carboxy-terminal domain RNA polymerase II polypeptide A small phosphatase 1-like [Populus alba x Populus x berolinensis]
MVSMSLKRSPAKSMKDLRSHRPRPRRRNRRKSPVKTTSSIISTINKTIFTCKRRLSKLFSKLTRISTPNSRYKDYKILKTGSKYHDLEGEKDAVCRALFFNERLPPMISPDKRTVFLDLDETLVHSKAGPPPQEFDFVVRPKIDGEMMIFYVLKRPGVDAFLEALGTKYEVVVFTAGLKEYATLVLDRIDPKGVISHRLYRDSCKQVDGKFVKDLSEMGRDLKRVVIVDDNPSCYIYQPENAIPVKPFLDDLGDLELGKLATFFDRCDCFEDMRDAVKEYVGGEGDVEVQVEV